MVQTRYKGIKIVGEKVRDVIAVVEALKNHDEKGMPISIRGKAPTIYAYLFPREEITCKRVQEER